MSLYLILNIGSFIIPFAYSFEKKMRFIKYWKSVFLSTFIVGFIFIIWDIIFTNQGVWGFNPQYHLGLDIFGLPLEEILFFICIPYASIFLHYAFIHFNKKTELSKFVTQIIIFTLLIVSIVLLINGFPKKYTTLNFSLFIILLLYSLLVDVVILRKFFITFMLILIPFFIVNGILTGSFIQDEVVWYNNYENLGFRLGTVPIEDLFYAFNMLYLNLILIEKFKKRFKNG